MENRLGGFGAIWELGNLDNSYEMYSRMYSSCVCVSW